MTDIYDRETFLPDIDPGETVTDVLVLARTVWFDDDGIPESEIYVGGTPTTPGDMHEIILRRALRDYLERESMGGAYMLDDDEEDL